MAYINVADWNADQVTDWLKGLDDSMYNYVYSFTNNEVGGHQLLHIRPYELEQLGMLSIGHQEIVLEAVEHLRNFHYNIDKENLQFLALNVATAARSLYRQLAHHCDKSKIETQILNDITRTIGTIKPVISWLDRSPFQGHVQFNEIRKNMLRLGLEMATSAQRDRFVENPVDQIRMTAEKLAKLADYIIQDITDPMLLQPASLNLVTLKKRESDLGFNIIPSYHGIHRVTDIKYNSPAHNSGKIEDGDEIVQINYQTVVGWQLKTVSLHLRESPPDVLLTLKKRPKHTKIYGQIYMQPYRLPSKKRSLGSRWGEHVPSPRSGFLAVPDFNLPIKVSEKRAIASSDSDSSCSDILTPTDDPKTEDKEIRLYYPKPRAVLQRRNTICGDELYGFRKVGNVPLWHERATGQIGDPSSPSLRDKSVSFGFGLEIAQRPTTCLGISTANGKFNELIPFNSTLAEKAKDIAKLKINESISGDKPKPGVSKVVRFDANMKSEDYVIDDKYTCKIENTILETFTPIPYADEEESVLNEENSITNEINMDAVEFRKESPPPLFIKPIRPECELVQAINVITVNRRGRLDKSHSTPAYDNSGEDSDTPPAIEPRNEFLNNVPPAPPPRPKRQSELIPPVVPPPPPKPNKTTASSVIVSPKPSPNVNISSVKFPNTFPSPVHVPLKESSFPEESELVTPTKTKTLTLKKKNSMIAKRRKISLKVLGTGEIQGHLYRRRKDKRGISFWAKLYFVLIETVLYGFRSKDAQKANCVVFLPGFTVSVAKEVHSRPFAFKVYHPSKTFYFAAESSEALNQWMEFIRQATLHDKYGPSSFNDNQVDVNAKELFSETDSSGDESDLSKQQLCTPSPVSSNTCIKGNSSKQPDTPISTKHYYFGSLKKFTKTSFKTHSDKKQSSDIPVPTDHFRTYRRMPGGSYGIQIGANTPAYQDNNIPPAYLGDHSTRNTSVSSNNNALNNPDALQLPQAADSRPRAPRDSLDENKKLCKTSPFNYIHASNPNLVEFSFQTSKTLDYSKPKINAANSWDAQSNLQGFVTLKDLMLQKQEEDAQEMYNNRVLLGVEKENANRRILQENTTISSSGNEKVPKIQMRSLPKTPDYEMSFKPDDEDIRRTRTKEGQKLRDFGYEFIYGDDPPTNDVSNLKKVNQSISSPPVVQPASLSKNKKHSSNSYSENVSEKSNRASSFKKRGKFDAFKTSSERLFQFKHSNNEKSTDSMTLPLHKKSLQIYNQQSNPVIGGSIKKSHTYNNDFKDKKYEAHRKNSAPMPILSKLNFTSNKATKEKKWLSSPRFQRAIFGTSVSSQHDYDHEIFLPITFPKTIGDESDTRSLENTCNRTQGTIEKPLPLPPSQTLPASVVTPEYPNLQCPPVFEPETYSLSDPNASLTLIRRRNNLEEPE